MNIFCMEIAGQVGQIQPLFESTQAYFLKYLTDRAPDFRITVTREDLVFEQQELDREAREEGMRQRTFTDPFLERAAIQRKFAEHLLSRNTLLLHGSCVAVDGEAFLFTAKCGTGKSTHTRLWMQVFGARAKMVNDDKPFLTVNASGVYACGSPWSGKHGLDQNITVPLRGICILQRGTENRIRPISPEEALPMLVHQSSGPVSEEEMPAFSKLVEEVARRVRLWSMQCTPSVEAAQVAYEAMSGKGEQI